MVQRALRRSAALCTPRCPGLFFFLLPLLPSFHLALSLARVQALCFIGWHSSAPLAAQACGGSGLLDLSAADSTAMVHLAGQCCQISTARDAALTGRRRQPRAPMPRYAPRLGLACSLAAAGFSHRGSPSHSSRPPIESFPRALTAPRNQLTPAPRLISDTRPYPSQRRVLLAECCV